MVVLLKFKKKTLDHYFIEVFFDVMMFSGFCLLEIMFMT